MIEAFGYECWRVCWSGEGDFVETYRYIQAPGEAEAELAYLNRIGFIDAVVTDDVDTLLFGASTIIRKYVSSEPHVPAVSHFTLCHQQ